MLVLPNDRPFVILSPKAWKRWRVKDVSSDEQVKISPHRLLARDREATAIEAYRRAWKGALVIEEVHEPPMWRYTIVKKRRHK